MVKIAKGSLMKIEGRAIICSGRRFFFLDVGDVFMCLEDVYDEEGTRNENVCIMTANGVAKALSWLLVSRSSHL